MGVQSITIDICARNPAGDSQYSNVDTAETAHIPSGQIPWVEDFNDLIDGSREDYGTTQWSVNTSAMGNLSGTFSVQYQMFDVSDTDGNGIWMSEKIDISSASAVDFSVKVISIGGLDETGDNYDYVRCYIKVDDNPDTLLAEFRGMILNNSGAGTLITKQNIVGDSLQIFLHSSTSYNDEHYYFDDISVTPVTTDLGQPNGKAILPENFELKQNYPNPFNAMTTISFSLPEKCLVSIDIYGINGIHISELLRDVKSPGDYSINWDASQYSSGTYLIQLKANGLTIIKKCLLIK